MLTPDEIRVIGDAQMLRHTERGQDLGFAVKPDLLPEAHRLVERGYLERRWHGDDLVYRATDTVMTAQALSNLTADPCPN